MARTTITITSLSNTAITAKPALASVVTLADGLRLAAGGRADNLLLELSIAASGSSGSAVSIAAGDNPPAFRAGIGALTLATAGSTAGTSYLLTFESARFADASGNIDVDFDSGVVTAATAAAYRLPNGL